MDRNGDKIKVVVSYPWLPARCSVCSKWGHKTTECQSKGVRSLHKSKEVIIMPEEMNVVEQGSSNGAVNVVETLLSELDTTCAIRDFYSGEEECGDCW